MPINLNTGSQQLMRELFEIQIAFNKFGVSREHKDTIEAIALKAFNDDFEREKGEEPNEPVFKEKS